MIVGRLRRRARHGTAGRSLRRAMTCASIVSLGAASFSARATAQNPAHVRPVGALLVGGAVLQLTADDAGTVFLSALLHGTRARGQWKGDALRAWLEAAEAMLRDTTSAASSETSRLPPPGIGVLLQRAIDPRGLHYDLIVGSSEVIVARLARPDVERLVHALRRADAAAHDPGGVAAREPEPPGVAPANGVRTERPYFEYQVEKQAVLTPDSPQPRYPDRLKTANVEGQVLVEFVVDAGGRVVPGTLEVIQSSHDDFTQAIRDVLPQLRFQPAEVGGVRVPQLVQRPFVFMLTPAERLRR